MTAHLRHAVAAAVAAMLAPLATYAGPAPAADAATTSATTTVRVATFNVQVRRSLDQFRAGVQPLLDRSDIVGLQEMDSREKEAWLTTLTDSGWQHFAVRPSFQEAVLWRSDRFDFVSGRTVKVSDARWIYGELPGQPSSQKARYLTVVRLLDKVTGRRVSVVNVHLMQGAVRGGVRRADRPHVWAIYRQSIINLEAVTAAERQWGRVFVTGDFNAGWVADRKHLKTHLPIRTFGRVRMSSMWAASRPSNGLGTHNDALIDQVFTDLRPISARVQFDLSGFSDHRPAIAVFATD